MTLQEIIKEMEIDLKLSLSKEEKDWEDGYNAAIKDYLSKLKSLSEEAGKVKAHLEGMYAQNKEGWEKASKYEKEKDKYKSALALIKNLREEDSHRAVFIAEEALSLGEELKGKDEMVGGMPKELHDDITKFLSDSSYRGEEHS